MQKCKIKYIESYVPGNVITNADISRIVDTTDEWIRTRTGIQQRSICDDSQDASDLAVSAAKKLVDTYLVDPNIIDVIIVATATSNRMPSAACKVQCAIKAKNACSFDVSAACSGFVYGLYLADSIIKSSDGSKNVLVIAADAMSQFVDWRDRSTCVLFGDGSAAALVSASDAACNKNCLQFCVMDTCIGATANDQDYSAIVIDSNVDNNVHVRSLCQNNTVRSNCDSIKVIQNHVPTDGEFIRMNGQYVFKNAIDTMSNAVQVILSRNGLTIDDVDWIIPHQANKRIIEAMCKFFNFDINRFVCYVERHANTSAASIPLALDVAIKDGKIKAGEKIVIVAFGAGFTYGASLLYVN